jgi:hypothetical protein
VFNLGEIVHLHSDFHVSRQTVWSGPKAFLSCTKPQHRRISFARSFGFPYPSGLCHFEKAGVPASSGCEAL